MASHEPEPDSAETALGYLLPKNADELREETVRWAVTELISILRAEAAEELPHITGTDLRDRLKAMSKAAKRLRRSLGDMAVSRALWEAYAARDSECDRVSVLAALERLPDALDRSRVRLKVLEVSAEAAIEKLSLPGSGKLGPWGAHELSLKQRTVIYAMPLFRWARQQNSRPTEKNTKFTGFLDVLWKALRPDDVAVDWTAGIRLARDPSIASKQGRELAVISAAVGAEEFMNSVEKHFQRGLSNKKN